MLSIIIKLETTDGQIVVHHIMGHYSAVSKRETDLYLLIWKDLPIKKHIQDAPVCVKYMRIYVYCLCVPRISLEGYTRN